MSVAGVGLSAADRRAPWHPRVAATLAAAALACLAALALAFALSRAVPGSRELPASRTAARALSSVPSALVPTLSATIGATDRGFWPVARGSSLETQGGGIRGTFTSSGAALRVAGGTLRLSLVGFGRGAHVAPVAPAKPRQAGSRVVFERGALSEFYRDGPYGLEQGFTLRRRPAAEAGPLGLALALGGSLEPRRVGSQIAFEAHSGAVALRYDDLSVRDAAGRTLPAQMQLHGRMLEIRIDDRRARYPLYIDPLIQPGGKLTANEEVGHGFFGASVALSSEGTTALIGGWGDNGQLGAAWVFTREKDGSTWTQQAKLVPTGETGKGQFGLSVALSADGSTALIGAPSDNDEGAVWVFTRSGSTWSQQGEKLRGGGEEHEALFGYSVALSGEGSTALVGGPGETNSRNERIGAAWVFTRSGSSWTQQGSELTGGGETGEGFLGESVALSSDGETALIGGAGDAEGVGAAWVFKRSGTSWHQQGSKLTGGGESGQAHFGESVALSSEGTTALVGGPEDSEDAGAVWAFTRSGTTWSQQGEKLTGGEESGRGVFGKSVVLASEGNTALIGGKGDNSEVGAAWVFMRSESKWAQQGEKLTGSEEAGAGLFGESVAMSSDGSTALVGGPADETEVGATWAFSNEAQPAVTGAASAVTRSSATLNATVNPLGKEVTTCEFEYGTTSKYGSHVACASLPGAGEVPVTVSAAVTGLSAHTTYHFRIVAKAGEATELGSDRTFTTGPKPTALTGAATSVTQTGATLNAEVNPEGAATTCRFEYGTTNSYGSSVACTSSPGSGESAVAVSASVTSLSANTSYYFRISATNSGGTTLGPEASFTTLPNRPKVTTEAATAITQTTATLNAGVTPENAAVTNCHFEYGETVSYGSSVSCTSLPGSGATPVAVSAALSGLSADKTYHYRIVATNAGGTSDGVDETFSTLPNAPTVVTEPASTVDQTSATLTATVNPNSGKVNNCHFEYGTSTKYGSTVACTPSPGSGNEPVTVTASITGLAKVSTYHYRVVATNAGGTSQGADEVFTTAPRPAVVTGAATAVEQTTATLNATVNPEGTAVSSCEFEYGTSTKYGSTVACTPSPGSGETAVAVSANLTGLSKLTVYHFRIVATNAAGTNTGADQTFATGPKPAVATGAASSLAQTSATLNATVNPDGGTVSSCEFEYGTTTSYGSSAPCASLPGSGEAPVAVSAAISGLHARTSYHFRIVATNVGGTSQGSDGTFTTLPNPPTVVTEPANSITQTSTTLNGTVNPNGGEVTSCRFEYGPTTEYGESLPCTSLPGAGEHAVSVSAPVTGLSANTSYYYRVVAVNAGGASQGLDGTFTTLPSPPTVVTGGATSVEATSVTLNATVNPNDGSVRSCLFEYGENTSYGSSAPCASSPGSGGSPVAVSASVIDLNPSRTYHFRIVAANDGGTSQGTDATVVTQTAPPTVVTGAASAVERTSATLNATVDPNGESVSSCEFEYGTTPEYGHSVACASSPGSGTLAVAVSATIEGLTKLTTYHFRIVATNARGPSKGADRSFGTGPKPTVVTDAASAVGPTSVTLNAGVDPNGGAVSNCLFEYGTTTEYGESAPCSPVPGAGEASVDVSASLTGLSPDTTYHYRVVAANAGGPSSGADGAFITLPNPTSGPSGSGAPPPAEGEPSATVNLTELEALLAAQLTPTGRAAKIAAVLRSGSYAGPFDGPESGTVVIDWYELPHGARLAKRSKPQPILIASGHGHFGSAGRIVIKIKLTAAGKRLLRHAARVQLTAKATFTPVGLPPVTVVKTFLLRR